MILIVDDSATNQVLLEALLQEEGFETQTAFSVREALKIMERRPPSLVLLDLLMPDVSGFQLLETLKKHGQFAHIPVIVVSAVGTAENMEACRNLGAAEFIPKPIDMPVFIQKVHEWSRKAR